MSCITVSINLQFGLTDTYCALEIHLNFTTSVGNNCGSLFRELGILHSFNSVTYFLEW